MADCAIFVLWDGNRALMEHRPDLGPGGPYRVYPGGKVEPGETHDAAMIREAWEEARIVPSVYSRLSTDDLWSGPNHYSPLGDSRGWRNVPFLVREWIGTPPEFSMDHQKARYEWVRPEEIAGEDDGYTCNAAIARLLLRLTQT